MNARQPRLLNALLPAAPLVIIVAAMEMVVRQGWVAAWLVPAPSRVARSLVSERDLWLGLRDTGVASLGGFALSATVGLLIAIALSSARWVQRTFYPYAVLFQTIPIIAIAPMLVIWIGFDIRTVIASAFIVSVFPVIANAINGLLSTDPALVDLFRLYGAGRVETLWKLRLPFALPAILTGFRVAGDWRSSARSWASSLPAADLAVSSMPPEPSSAWTKSSPGCCWRRALASRCSV